MTEGSQAVAGEHQLLEQLTAVIDRKRVLTRPIDLIAFASDASFYRLIPKGQSSLPETSKRFRRFSVLATDIAFR